jgi:hypothetical protein
MQTFARGDCGSWPASRVPTRDAAGGSLSAAFSSLSARFLNAALCAMLEQAVGLAHSGSVCGKATLS